MRPGGHRIGVLVVAAVCGCPHLPRAQPAQVPPASADVVIVPAGEHLLLELQDSVHTRISRPGERIRFRVIENVRVGSELVVPYDSTARATLLAVTRSGRVKGRAEIRLRFDEIALLDGTSLPLCASVIRAGNAQVESGESQPGAGPGKADSPVAASGSPQGAAAGVTTGGAPASILSHGGPELLLPRSTLFAARVEAPIQVSRAAAQRAAALWAQRPFRERVFHDPVDSQFPPDAEPEERPPAPRPVLRRGRDHRRSGVGQHRLRPRRGDIAPAAALHARLLPG